MSVTAPRTATADSATGRETPTPTAPVRPISARADGYKWARRLLQHRDKMMMAEAAGVYRDSPREALGMMRGYRLAVAWLREAECSRLQLAAKCEPPEAA